MSALNRIQQPLGKLQGKVAVITGEILQWVLENAKTPRAPWEIETWSAFMEKRGPDSDAETLALFAEYVGQHSKTREDVKTWLEAIELDDYASFGGKP
jgi:hypothetical protein